MPHRRTAALLCSLQVLLYHTLCNLSRVFRNFFQKKWVKIARNFVDYFVQLDKYKKVCYNNIKWERII